MIQQIIKQEALLKTHYEITRMKARSLLIVGQI